MASTSTRGPSRSHSSRSSRDGRRPSSPRRCPRRTVSGSAAAARGWVCSRSAPQRRRRAPLAARPALASAPREATTAEAPTHGFARAFGTAYRRASGETIRVDATRRIVDHHGRHYEIVIYRESAEREAAEAARREATDLRAVALLASAAAHESNNPLTVAVGSLALLSRHLAPDHQERRSPQP